MAEEKSPEVSSSSAIPLLQSAPEDNNSDSRTIRSTTSALFQDRLEGRQSTTEKRFLFSLDITWNLVLAIVSAVMLLCTQGEHPTTPIRLWIEVYALQCLIRVALLVIDDFVFRNTSNPARTSNTVISFVWWVLGVYWVVAGGYFLQHYAPHLYWLAIAFLSIRVAITASMCIVLPCICGCLPIIINILSADSGEA